MKDSVFPSADWDVILPGVRPSTSTTWIPKRNAVAGVVPKRKESLTLGGGSLKFGKDARGVCGHQQKQLMQEGH